jgi:PAS domain S-box-containing protein
MIKKTKTKGGLIKELHDLQQENNSLKELCRKNGTRLNQSEINVSKNEEIFRKAYLTSPDSININRLSDGMYVSVNEGFTRILGFAEKDVIGKTSMELNIWFNSDDRRRLVKELESEGEAWNFEAKFISKDRKIINGLMSASIFDLDGVPHILNVTRDITDRKQVEDAFRKLSLRQEAILAAVPEIIMEVDKNKIYTWANRSGLEFFGKDVIGKEASLYFEGEQETYKIVQPIFDGAEDIFYVESWQRRYDGKKRLLAWWCRALKDEEGSVTGALSSARDITERRQAEEELAQEQYLMRTLMDNLPDHIYFKDRDSRVIRVNKAMAQFVGLDEPDQAIGKTDFDFFTGEHAQQAFDDEHNIIRTGQMLSIEEKETHRDRSDTWASTVKMPLLDKDRHTIGTFGISRDITSHKLAEEEIRLKNQQLQNINAEKDKFFSIIAHDLRAPLSAFLGVTQILTEEIQDMSLDEIKEITISMKESASNLSGLLENLLEWSRLKRSRMDFVPEKLNLKQKVTSCINVLTESARKKKIKVNYALPEDLTINADSHMFDAIIRNLVSNAIKFTPRSGEINVSATVTPNDTVEIIISDTGIGMNRELIDKLFLINERTNRKGTEGELSTGLGLLLCKEFIEKHGGKIFVESEEGKGSTFCFTIKRQ